jgi:LPS export ABC transporter permease LptG
MTRKRRSSFLIDIYTLKATVPYITLSLLVLTAALMAHQSNRFVELLLTTAIPTVQVTEIIINLLPATLIFAVPAAVLSGTLIGFSRMGSDSETIVLRAVGVSSYSIVRATIALSLVISLMMLYISLILVPQSATAMRRILLQATLHKLDSPVEPRVFNLEFEGKTIYVRDGDKERGQWGRVFIHSKDEKGNTTVLTARNGRIDFSADQSELVLTEASSTILYDKETSKTENSYITERLSHLRVRLPTPGRREITEQLNKQSTDLDEMPWKEVIERVFGNRTDNIKANIIAHRKLTLSLAPAIFALLGVGFGLRVRRGGKGLGVVLAMMVMIVYYTLSLAGEQLVRSHTLSIISGMWLTNALTIILGVGLLLEVRNPAAKLRKRVQLFYHFFYQHLSTRYSNKLFAYGKPTGSMRDQIPVPWTPRLLDTKILKSLFLSFTLAYISIASIFIIFTLFELWRYVINNGTTLKVVAQYILYLMPLITVSIAATSTLVATLYVYALIARRSEAVAWWACGESAYRLVIPGIIFAALISSGLWYVQEALMPSANIRQDSLRSQIKGVSKTPASSKVQWLAPGDGRTIYAYTYNESNGQLQAPIIFEFDEEGIHLRRVIEGSNGRWEADHSNNLVIQNSRTVRVGQAGVEVDYYPELRLNNTQELFKPSLNKPSQLSTRGLIGYIQVLKSQNREVAELEMALAKKQVDPQTPLVIALIGIPLALAFGKRSAITSLAVAVGIGMIFWGVTNGFYHLGASHFLPPVVAAWIPMVIFSAIGLYLLSRTRT